jgi:hypothetical protein
MVEDSTWNVRPVGETAAPAWLDASRDDEERPILAWGDFGYYFTYRDVGCAAFPTDSGWDLAVEIPGSEQIYTTPRVVRDLNGDGWFSWNRLRQQGLWYTHTYVKATVGLPTVSGSESSRTLSWLISEPAPKSWWAVLRAEGAGPLAPIARVQAGAGTSMSYTDATPAGSNRLRYAIRRESVDKRYEWTGGARIWFPEPRRIKVWLPAGNPVRDGMLRLAVSGAAQGTLDVRIYDLMGREVWRVRPTAGGTGEDTLALRLSDAPRALRPGLYLLRVEDVAGHTAETAKFVVLR